jgi:hydrogenase/urease accessory protein HupE
MNLIKLLLFFLLGFSVYAHEIKENYLKVNFDASTKTLQLIFEIETRPLENKYPQIDDSGNEIISFKELKNHEDLLLNYFLTHINLTFEGTKIDLSKPKVLIHEYVTATYMQLSYSFNNISLDGLKVDYNLYFELENDHLFFIHATNNQGDIILNKELRSYKFSSTKISQFERLVVFIEDGIKHILIGLDHLLFILMILIPTFIQKESYWKLFKLITTFSLAHSITLFLAAYKIYIPNAVIVESAIALSILVVALLNFIKLYQHVNYLIIFAFGLMHGFGFANVLTIAKVDDTTSFFVSLLGFNLGVEIGQIFTIALYMLVLILIAKLKFKEAIVQTLSLLTALLALYWFIQRLGFID